MLVSYRSSCICHNLIHLRSIFILMDVKIYSWRHDDNLLITLWLLFLVGIIDLLNLLLPYVLNLRNIFLTINIHNFVCRNNLMFSLHNFRFEFLIKSFHNLRWEFILRSFLTNNPFISRFLSDEIIKLCVSILIVCVWTWRIKIWSMRFISRIIWGDICIWLKL